MICKLTGMFWMLFVAQRSISGAKYHTNGEGLFACNAVTTWQKSAAMSQRRECLMNNLLLGCLALILPSLLAATPAFGASRQTQEKVARKACLTGDYEKGVSILADLFVETKNAVYVFNQGRCLEQNLRYREAIGRFDEYLRLVESSKDRATAEKHIADCRARLQEDTGKTQGTVPQPFVQPLPPPNPTPGNTSRPDSTTLVEQPQTQPEPPKNRSGLLTAGIVTGVVGVAALSAGIAFNLKANSMVNEMETKLDAYNSSKNSTRGTYEALTWVGYGVGAACIVTGAILGAVGASSRHHPSTDIALAPAVGPGQAGLILSGGF
jgi:hypothetical protein